MNGNLSQSPYNYGLVAPFNTAFVETLFPVLEEMIVFRVSDLVNFDRLPTADQLTGLSLAPSDDMFVVFISHTWYDKDHADSPTGDLWRALRNYLFRARPQDYIWMDVLCIPPDIDMHRKKRFIYSIPHYMSRTRDCWAFAFDLQRYLSSAWCFLETMAAPIWVLGYPRIILVRSGPLLKLHRVPGKQLSHVRVSDPEDLPHVLRIMTHKLLGYGVHPPQVESWVRTCYQQNNLDFVGDFAKWKEDFQDIFPE